MSKGPTLGKFTLSVDGGTPVTVDTYAASRQDRIVVWKSSGLTGDSGHTITITNKATWQRPTIIVDAIFVAGS